jgi:hypothetical protein
MIIQGHDIDLTALTDEEINAITDEYTTRRARYWAQLEADRKARIASGDYNLNDAEKNLARVDKSGAIKAHRQRTNFGLKESLDMVNDFLNENGGQCIATNGVCINHGACNLNDGCMLKGDKP